MVMSSEPTFCISFSVLNKDTAPSLIVTINMMHHVVEVGISSAQLLDP